MTRGRERRTGRSISKEKQMNKKKETRKLPAGEGVEVKERERGGRE